MLTAITSVCAVFIFLALMVIFSILHEIREMVGKLPGSAPGFTEVKKPRRKKKKKKEEEKEEEGDEESA